MTLQPCIECGEPTTSTRCQTCRPPDVRPSAAVRGYDAAWRRLSRAARKAQPWCLDCGATEDLTTDHSAETWRRKAAGKRLRLVDVEVVCRGCNARRGAARGPSVDPTQGGAPLEPDPGPSVNADFPTLSGRRR